MVSKKTKQAKRAAAAAGAKEATEESANGSAVPVAEGSKPSTPDLEPPPEEETSEQVKEQGNAAFKAGKYSDAIALYSKAIAMNPKEPSYLTNRAASYIGLKRFRPALDDCQAALSLHNEGTTPTKILLRLARCQAALGQPTQALGTLTTVLSTEPSNATAKQLKSKVVDLQNHLRTVQSAREKKDWSLLRLGLDKCLQGIEGEGAEVPIEWRLWKVEMELAKGNFEVANNAANDALRLHPTSPEILALRGKVLFLSGKIPGALQTLASALRMDPSFEPAQRLRKRVKEVERLKDEGNALFKESRWRDAVARYSDALDLIGDADDECKGGQIRATLLSNRATTLLKLNDYPSALQDTNASLNLSPSSFKALRTRARIHSHLEEYEKSISDFHSAIDQASSEGITQSEIRTLKSELHKTEVALKRSKTKDYYKILGLSKDCSDLDIKKAYRRESLIHHPDKGGDEEKFKLVVEAHAVLSDPTRRRRYDAGEDEDGMSDSSNPFGAGGGGSPFGSPFGGGMSQADIANLFAQFGGGGGGPAFSFSSHADGPGGFRF